MVLQSLDDTFKYELTTLSTTTILLLLVDWKWWYFNAYILWLNDFWRAQFGSLILMEKLLSMSLVTNPMIEWLRYETQQQWNCVFLSINQSNAINLSIKKCNEISLYIFCSYYYLNYELVALSIHLRLYLCLHRNTI